MYRDAQTECTAMVQSATAAAAAHLPRRGAGLRITSTCPRRDATDGRAHDTWLRSRSAVAKKARNRASHKADAALLLDRQRRLGAPERSD
eukprot:363185-Chlamydomonas_euryale.AAC.4